MKSPLNVLPDHALRGPYDEPNLTLMLECYVGDDWVIFISYSGDSRVDNICKL